MFVEKDIKEIIDRLDEKNDLRMKEYIAVVNTNDPHEKSRIISELKKEIEKITEQLRPLLEAFNENRVSRMVFDKKTRTVYLRSKEILTIGGAIGILYTFLKIIIPKLFAIK